jgi:hypothetical protein
MKPSSFRESLANIMDKRIVQKAEHIEERAFTTPVGSYENAHRRQIRQLDVL